MWSITILPSLGFCVSAVSTGYLAFSWPEYSDLVAEHHQTVYLPVNITYKTSHPNHKNVRLIGFDGG